MGDENEKPRPAEAEPGREGTSSTNADRPRREEPARPGFFKASRATAGLELLKANHHAFVLLYVIAHRARWREGFNQHGLGTGEAFIGDHDSCGLTEGEYRAAKKFLAKHGLATFRATNRGTIAALINTEVFDVLPVAYDGQNYTNTPPQRRTDDGQTTTNKEGKEGEAGKNLNLALTVDASPRNFHHLIPDALNTPEFIAAWGRWIADRKKRRKEVTEEAAKLQLAKLTGFGLRDAIASINQSIERAYTGFFPPRPTPAGQSVRPTPKPPDPKCSF